MAIVSCSIDRASGSWTGTLDIKSQNSATVRYVVLTDTVNDGPSTILSASQSASPNPTKKPGSRYTIGNDTIPGVVLLSKTAERVADGLTTGSDCGGKWIVTETYGPGEENGENGEQDNDNNPHPLMRPAKAGLTFELLTKIVEFEANIFGNPVPIVNGVGDPFANPPQIDDARPVLVISKNYGNLLTVLNLAESLVNHVNDAAFMGAPEKTLKCSSVTTTEEPQIENGIKYWPTVFKLAYSKDGWNFKPLDQGMRFKDDQGNLVQAKDEAGFPTSEPVLLAADGTALPAGQQGRFLDFEVYPAADFSVIPVPRTS